MTATTEPAPITVAVVGARGRMGSLAATTIEADPGLHLVAKIGRGDPLEECRGAKVVVDFSTSENALQTAGWCIDNGVHVLIGATGMHEDGLAALERRLSLSPHSSSMMVIPNFSIAALLARKFGAIAAGSSVSSCSSPPALARHAGHR